MAATGKIDIASIQTGYASYEVIKYAKDPGFRISVTKGTLRTPPTIDLNWSRGGVIPFNTAKRVLESSSFGDPVAGTVTLGNYVVPTEVAIASIPVFGGNKLIGRPEPMRNKVIRSNLDAPGGPTVTRAPGGQAFGALYDESRSTVVREFFGYYSFVPSAGGGPSDYGEWRPGRAVPTTSSPPAFLIKENFPELRYQKPL